MAALLQDKEPGDLVDRDARRRRGAGAPQHARRKPDRRRSRRRRHRRHPTSVSPAISCPTPPLVDQNGVPTSLSDYRGHRVALTFIYTRCPLPEFCPLMDRHFAAVQKTLASTPALADVRLRHRHARPGLRHACGAEAYAARRGADPKIWSFLTGEPAEVNTVRIAARRLRRAQSAERHRHHPQPPNRRHRSRRPPREGPQRQFLDAVRARCRPHRGPRSHALNRPIRRRSR